MKAIAFENYGPPEVLRLMDLSMPEVGTNDVLIRVKASGVNPADWRLRNGQFRRAFRLKMPFIPGSDVAGEVERVGSGVTQFQKGDRVFAMLPLKSGGGYAEFAAVNANTVASMPLDGRWDEYGATPLAGLTAWQGLIKYGRLQPGQTVLVNGGSGGVGSFAIQIASAMGAHVTAVTSGRNAGFVQNLGAFEVINYETENIFRGPRRFDIVFDTIAEQPFRRWSTVLKGNGVVVTVNPIIGKLLPRFLTKMLGIDQLQSFFVEPDANGLSRLAELIASRRLTPQIEAAFPLDEAAKAQQMSESGRVRGKIVLTHNDVKVGVG